MSGQRLRPMTGAEQQAVRLYDAGEPLDAVCAATRLRAVEVVAAVELRDRFGQLLAPPDLTQNKPPRARAMNPGRQARTSSQPRKDRTMTTVLDAPKTAAIAACQTPEKLDFSSRLEALAEAAVQESRHDSTNTPYECVGHWHNTTHDNAPPKPLRTASARIDREALLMLKAPLKPGTGLSVGFFVLTPKIAAYWLREFNSHNRNLRDRGASSLAIDIITGGWDLNGDTIGFSTDGVMIDGQHRCTAVAQSDIPVPIILVTGLEPVAQDTVDTNMRRTFADALRLAGEPAPLRLAGVTAAVCRWKAGQLRGGGKTNLSINVLKRVLRDHPEMRESLPTMRRVAAKIGSMPQSMVGLAWWLFNGLSAEDCADFFTKLYDGSGLEKNDPIWVLRETLEDNAKAKRKLSGPEFLACVIKAWNAYREGRQIKQLWWRSGGARPEPFPMPH